MNTQKTDYILNYYTIKKNRALKNLDLIDEIRRQEITLEEINKNVVFSISDLPDHFSLLEVESEIRKNVLEIKDENSLLQYFYYLIKIHHKLKGCTKGIGEEINYLKKRYNITFERAVIDPFQSKFNSFEELKLFCYWELNSILSSPIQFYTILKGEFGFKVKDWKDKVINNAELPSFFEIKSMFISDMATKEFSTIEPLPEYEFKRDIQKMAWLNELGILKPILERCKEGGSYNYYRAVNVIQSFTDISKDAIKNALEAIFKPNEGNKKNHPLNNPKNKLFVSEMIEKFKLDKEKED